MTFDLTFDLRSVLKPLQHKTTWTKATTMAAVSCAPSAVYQLCSAAHEPHFEHLAIAGIIQTIHFCQLTSCSLWKNAGGRVKTVS